MLFWLLLALALIAAEAGVTWLFVILSTRGDDTWPEQPHRRQ
jgi:hypothetical protein